jgi:hypothetical protein
MRSEGSAATRTAPLCCAAAILAQPTVRARLGRGGLAGREESPRRALPEVLTSVGKRTDGTRGAPWTGPGWRYAAAALSAISALIITTCVWRASKYYFVDVPHYDARAREAQQNAQFLTSHNMRRTGDIITIVGTAAPFASPATNRGAFAQVELDDVPFTVTLSGSRAPICAGDRIAASGTYHYGAEGGVLWTADSSNVSRKFHDYVSRLDFVFLAIDPSWCGFPGFPINGPYPE